MVFCLYDELAKDASNIKLDVATLSLKRFKANPVMIDSHYGEIIGRWENIKKVGKKIFAKAVFDMKSERARRIKEQIADGFLRMVSVGFTGNWGKFEPAKNGEGGTFYNDEITEASIVKIGDNAGALLQKSLNKGDNMKLYTMQSKAFTNNNIKVNMKDILSKYITDEGELAKAIAELTPQADSGEDLKALTNQIKSLTSRLDNCEAAILETASKRDLTDFATAKSIEGLVGKDEVTQLAKSKDLLALKADLEKLRKGFADEISTLKGYKPFDKGGDFGDGDNGGNNDGGEYSNAFNEHFKFKG